MWRALAIALPFVAGAVLSVQLIQGEDRFAGAFLCGFGGVCALVTAAVYLPRARDFDRLFQDPPLADWTYADDEWRRFIQENFQRNKAGNWGLWLLMAVMCLLIGGGLAWASGDPLFLLITFGIAVFLLLPATLVPLARRRRLSRGQARAVINRQAAWIGGQFQSWGRLGSHLISATMDESSQPPLLCITFRFHTQTGPQEESVLIPVPAGQDAAARQVADALRRSVDCHSISSEA